MFASPTPWKYNHYNVGLVAKVCALVSERGDQSREHGASEAGPHVIMPWRTTRTTHGACSGSMGVGMDKGGRLSREHND